MTVEVAGEPQCPATGRPATGQSSAEYPRAARKAGVEDALVHALAEQGSVGIIQLDNDLMVRDSSVVAQHFHGLTVSAGVRVDELVPAGERAALLDTLREVLRTGTPLLNQEQTVSPSDPLVVVAMSALRSVGEGRTTGLVVAFVDITEQTRASRRLELLFHAADSIGDSLDVETTARQLADIFVPSMAGVAAVNLAVEVFDGEEPAQHGDRELGLRRAALTSVIDSSPPYIQPGEDVPSIPRGVPLLEEFRAGGVMAKASRADLLEALGGREEMMSRFVPPAGDAYIGMSLVARGVILGSIELFRPPGAEPFDDWDARQLVEIASRGALSIDNARRYTRERTASIALQRSLLPPGTTDTTAAKAAGVYLPAGGVIGVGGDWYDAIPLSSLRVAFVIGDVVGHGLRATATMGRLRTAVQALADLDMPPDELLTHLDGLVTHLRRNQGNTPEEELAGTCFYAVYDAVTGRCAMASAGHAPPMLVRPDGTVEPMDVAPGPPLGVGGSRSRSPRPISHRARSSPSTPTGWSRTRETPPPGWRSCAPPSRPSTGSTST